MPLLVSSVGTGQSHAPGGWPNRISAEQEINAEIGTFPMIEETRKVAIERGGGFGGNRSGLSAVVFAASDEEGEMLIHITTERVHAIIHLSDLAA
ncbi:MAG: hypothetical protein ACREF3_17430, partial [Acetobacteraceae bacterium]